jgi:hypothetical protein
MKSLQERWKEIRTTSIVTFIKNVRYFKNILEGKVIEDPSKPQETGTLIHLYLLENSEFNRKYITLDYDKPRGEVQSSFCSFVADNLVKYPNTDLTELCIEAYKNCYKASKKSNDKITEESKKLYESLKDYIKFLTYKNNKDVISFRTLNTLRETQRVVEEHKLASKLIFEDIFSTEKHYNELYVLWEYSKALIDGEPIVIKSTIDKLIIDHENKIIKLVDLKTTGDITEFENKFYDHDNYKVQLACYWFAVETYFRENFPDKNISEYSRETYLVAVQTKNPYRDYPVNCEVWPISEKTLADGLDIIEKALPDLAWHFENNLWDHSRSYYEGNGANKML